MHLYRHSQPGTMIVSSIGLTAVIAVGIATLGGGGPVSAGTMAVMAAVVLVLVATLFLFHSLTVAVTEEELSLHFGTGLIRKRWPMEEVVAAHEVRNPWWYGWGIHLTPRGWLYNIAGFDAVEVELEGGRRFRVGTDEPSRLIAAIESARQRARRRPPA